MTIRLSP